jgi:hypothetical protein
MCIGANAASTAPDEQPQQRLQDLANSALQSITWLQLFYGFLRIGSLAMRERASFRSCLTEYASSLKRVHGHECSLNYAGHHGAL